MSNEVKVRRSTRLLALANRDAELISQKDSKETQKENAAMDKKEHNCKRKIPPVKAEAGVDGSALKDKVERTSDVPEQETAPVVLWKAPVARMY